MKTYRISVNTGDYTTLEAEDKEDLMRKLSTGAYGVLPVRGRNMIHFTPETVSEIVEIEQDQHDS